MKKECETYPYTGCHKQVYFKVISLLNLTEMEVCYKHIYDAVAVLVEIHNEVLVKKL